MQQAYETKLWKNDLTAAAERIKQRVYEQVAELHVTYSKSPEPVPFQERLSGEYRSITVGEKWGELWDCAWFHFTGTVPACCAGKSVVLLLDLSGEGCLFDGYGTPYRGITSVTSSFDRELGVAGKRVVRYLEPAHGGEAVDVWVDAGCNDLFGKYQRGELQIGRAHV